jgi:PhnB protein
MASVSTYLNFTRNTEEAFNFYKSVFGTEFEGKGFMRFKDIPPGDEMGPLPEEDQNLVMHVTLPILDGHYLMGTDTPESLDFKLNPGNNVYINLMPDTREETRRLFNALSEGGEVETELQDMFWGDYYGSCKDKFGVQWMFNCSEKAES